MLTDDGRVILLEYFLDKLKVGYIMQVYICHNHIKFVLPLRVYGHCNRGEFNGCN